MISPAYLRGNMIILNHLITVFIYSTSSRSILQALALVYLQLG